MFDWNKLLLERNAWVAYNFPKGDGKSAETLWGCMEEVGELAHAHLKERQNIRGTAAEHQAAAKDAIGDLTVYLLGAMRYASYTPTEGWTPDPEKQPTSADQCLLNLAHAVGKLCTGELYRLWDQPIEGYDRYELAIEMVVFFSRTYCDYRSWDYEAIVQGTWDAVKERDWILYPDTGRPPAHGDTGYLEPEAKAARSDGDPGNAVTPPSGAPDAS